MRLRPDGSRDRTFGRRGLRVVSFRGRWTTPLAVAAAPGGRIVVGGNAGLGAEAWHPAVARLTPAGRPDGVLRSDFTPIADRVTALVIAADRMVAAGTTGSSLGVARYVLR